MVFGAITALLLPKSGERVKEYKDTSANLYDRAKVIMLYQHLMIVEIKHKGMFNTVKIKQVTSFWKQVNKIQ